jgi:uncharacterized protein YggE
MEFQEIKNTHGKKQIFVVLGIVLCLFLAALVVSTAVDVQNKIKQGKYIGREFEFQKTISVSGTGEIYAKPDLAIVDFSVVSEAKTVSPAMEDNTGKMNAVIEAVKSLGVQEQDLKTTGFNISPKYEWYYTQPCLYLPCPQNRVLVGYEVSQTLEVKIRDMAKIGDVIQKATAAGSNQAGDLRLTIDKQDELKKQARERAIEEAKNKAGELASQLGVKLVKIVSFSESGVSPFFPYYMEGSALGKGGGEAAAPQIETGQNKIEITVSITYLIEER